MILKNKILILGSTGMLGSTVLEYLSTKNNLQITAPLRKDLNSISFRNYNYIINCIGIIKQKLINPEEAIRINSLFPYTILKRKSPNAKVIQIATDCVFSGKRGKYTEEDEHDALDIYGKTKSLGEVKDKNFYNIRCSIIGIDKDKVSLLSWFLSQKKNSIINGYSNHYWNGITTLEFAKICLSIIEKKSSLPNFINVVPLDIVSKYELLKIFAEKFNRKDIHINKVKDKIRIDRSLDSIFPIKYELTIDQMVERFAEYVRK